MDTAPSTLAGHAGDPLRQSADHPGQTVSEAAAARGISERTIRRMIKSGRLAAVRVAGPYGDEWRIADHPGQPAAQGRHSAGDPPRQRSGDPGHTVDPPLTEARLREQLTGARLAAKMLAQRLREAQAQAVRERDQHAGEVTFLRRQVEFQRDQLEEARQAEQQLRMMLAVTQRPALAATAAPPRPPSPARAPRRWRWPWRRRGGEQRQHVDHGEPTFAGIGFRQVSQEREAA